MISQEKKKKIKAEIECGQSVKICVIKDKVSGLYSTPLSFNSIESAKRYFKSLLTSQGLSSDDYEMYYLADFSPSTATLYIDDCYLAEPQVLPLETEIENAVKVTDDMREFLQTHKEPYHKGDLDETQKE